MSGGKQLALGFRTINNCAVVNALLRPTTRAQCVYTILLFDGPVIDNTLRPATTCSMICDIVIIIILLLSRRGRVLVVSVINIAHRL